MDIKSVTKDYVTCASGGAVTAPFNGSWISAYAIHLGATTIVNGSWLQTLCVQLGITQPLYNSWVIALANYYGITQPVNGSWWYAIADEACNGGIRPVANFTSDVTTITEGGTVNFQDTSTVAPGGPAITQWDWVFQGGTPATSSLQNPSVVYNTPGNYEVSLTVTNADGSNTKTVTNYMTVTVVPIVADFSASTVTPQPGDSVTFTDLSTGTPTNWSWTFNGGTPASSTTQNPVIQYNTVGTYSVELTASKTGSTDTETKTNYITVAAAPVPITINSWSVGAYNNSLVQSTTDFVAGAYGNNIERY